MGNEIRAAVEGLASLLEGVPGLRVHRQPPAALNELPAAAVLFESRGASRTLGGTGFAGRVRVVLAVPAADASEGFDRLYEFMAQSGESSIEAAAASDPTWGGSVDDGRLASIDNAGRRRLWGGEYIAADFHFDVVKGGT